MCPASIVDKSRRPEQQLGRCREGSQRRQSTWPLPCPLVSGPAGYGHRSPPLQLAATRRPPCRRAPPVARRLSESLTRISDPQPAGRRGAWALRGCGGRGGGRYSAVEGGGGGAFACFTVDRRLLLVDASRRRFSSTLLVDASHRCFSSMLLVDASRRRFSSTLLVDASRRSIDRPMTTSDGFSLTTRSSSEGEAETRATDSAARASRAMTRIRRPRARQGLGRRAERPSHNAASIYLFIYAYIIGMMIMI